MSEISNPPLRMPRYIPTRAAVCSRVGGARIGRLPIRSEVGVVLERVLRSSVGTQRLCVSGPIPARSYAVACLERPFAFVEIRGFPVCRRQGSCLSRGREVSTFPNHRVEPTAIEPGLPDHAQRAVAHPYRSG